MTREEAMDILDKMPLCNECDSSNFPYTCVECGNAFLMAMEALKQPEVVRCKDCKFQVDKGRRYPECDKHFLLAKDDWFCADGKRPNKEVK